MAYLLDTNVAIHLRDGDAVIDERVDALSPPLLLSIVSRVELEADLGRMDASADERRARLDALLDAVPVLPFGAAEAQAYRKIVETCGFSRRKVLDRMIAAQAITAGATLVTRNGEDFRDIPGLMLLEW
ncbi:MAG: PIN domain-containing protein [Pseudomonadota bacterium]|uniref:PIN domain-containing protein n=1 Tax=Brevundimonas sp. BT-123 TaxID=2986928 RepID=UPI0022354DE0|nr:PIN domain-containing protein [Brevundimonas sp. BT-123]MCW0047801.1 PIN domain-containing protein [Brevundimonas sp. BT-123]MEE2849888.1 PIN domain-containing protein [Pseudomonadota bacterium]